MAEDTKEQTPVNPFSFLVQIVDTAPMMLRSEWRHTGHGSTELITTRLTAVKTAMQIAERRGGMTEEETAMLEIGKENTFELERELALLRNNTQKGRVFSRDLQTTDPKPPTPGEKLTLSDAQQKIMDGIAHIFEKKDEKEKVLQAA